jgi:hypothetical protein
MSILVGSQKVFVQEAVAAGASVTSDEIAIDNNFDRMTVKVHTSKAGVLEVLALLNDAWYPAITVNLADDSFDIFSSYHFLSKVKFRFTAGVAPAVVSCEEDIVNHVSN